ncbi:MAG: hypothetical protein LJF06_07140 [Gemmatimonadetes bacterium]|nr:hypothetical protein [Gemmatimonadota bacterium]
MIGRALGGRSGLGLVMVGLCLAAPVGLAAQKADSTKAPTKPGQPAELVFVREVFTYPSVVRRNPFAPLSTADRGPRFDQLRLMGVIYDDHDPTASVAMLGTSSVHTSQDSTDVSITPRGQTWYLKVGETTGNVRVVEIRPDFSVVVEVDEFGITQRKVMRMDTPGGTQ